MKKSLAILTLALLTLALPAVAQKYACVNTDYVLKSIPDYVNAQKRLDKYVADWREELAGKQAELETLRTEYEQESYLLPDNLKKRRQEEIQAKAKEVKDLQQQRFGPGGDLDKKRAELLKPIQDRVYAMIERVAHEKNYAFVFDKAASATVLFVNKKFDISDEVLELLGFKPSAEKAAPNEGAGPEKKVGNPEMRRPRINKDRNEDFPRPINNVNRNK